MMLGGGGGGGGGGSREGEGLGRISHLLIPPPLPLHLDPSSAAISGTGAGGGHDDFRRRDERVPQWGQQETRDLITIRVELERDFSAAKRNKTLWEVVSGRMKELGYRRTADQCKCKWKNLVSQYKGKETSDPDNGRHCSFFEELHALFNERAKSMQRMLPESEAGSVLGKKRVKRTNKKQTYEESSDGEDEEEEDSTEDRATRSSNSRKRKVEKEKSLGTSTLEKGPRQPSLGNVKNGGSNLSSLQEILQEFLMHQQRIEIMWMEAIEKHAHERHMFEQEWRQSMEKLERERLMVEQAWKEREEQRRIREEGRAERKDALLMTLLNKLNGESP